MTIDYGFCQVPLRGILIQMDNVQLTRYALNVQRGDRESFRPLVEQLSRRLIAIAVRYTRNWDAALDITQETWMNVYENINRFDPAYPVERWIRVIHRNNCFSYLRSQRSRERFRERYASGEIDRANEKPDPYKNTVLHEFGQRLRSAMEKLTESQRAVFSLVAFEEMDPRDAAEALDMNRSTLRATLHFARKRLAEILRNEEA